jgi:hypothetical protein
MRILKQSKHKFFCTLAEGKLENVHVRGDFIQANFIYMYMHTYQRVNHGV